MPRFCIPATLSKSPDAAPFATLLVLCGCLQPPSAHATPPCRSYVNICSLHSCKRPSPRPASARTPVSRPRLGSHSQETQRSQASPKLHHRSPAGGRKAERLFCGVLERTGLLKTRRMDANVPLSWEQRHSGKLGHPCLELRAAARLTRTLTEVKRQLLWAAHEGGLASAAGPPASFPPHRTLCLLDADV